MPEFLYRITPTRLDMLKTGPTEEEAEATRAHFAYLESGVDLGHVMLAGRTLTNDERTFGIVVFRARTEAEAQAFVDGDPAVQKGVMRAELFPFRLAIHATD